MKQFNYILLFISIVLFSTCKHKCQDKTNIACENYDPCTREYPTTANFVMEEDPGPILSKVWKFYDCDTAIAPNSIRFTANDSLCESYTWTIGAGTFTHRQFSLQFPASVIGKSIPVTLVVKRKPNTQCFADDDGYDTITRTLYFVDKCQSLINGKFFGTFDNNTKDTATVTTYNCNNLNTFRCKGYIDNLMSGFKIDTSWNNSKCKFGTSTLYAYKELWVNIDGCSQTLRYGLISCKLEKNNTDMAIDFNYWDTASRQQIYKTFIGRRVK